MKWVPYEPTFKCTFISTWAVDRNLPGWLCSRMTKVIISDKITETFYFLSLKLSKFSAICTYYLMLKIHLCKPWIHSHRAVWTVNKETFLISPFHTPLSLPQVTTVESLMCMILGLLLYTDNIHMYINTLYYQDVITLFVLICILMSLT